MYKSKSRWQLGAGLLCIVLLATACFKSVDDQPQSTIVSERNTETWTPIPPSETPAPTEEETEEIVAEVVDQPISDVDTETPTATVAATQIAQSGEGGTGENQPDAFQLTATELIRTATEGVQIQQTQTAAALGIGVFTDTPVFTLTVDPIFGSLTPVQVQPTTPIISGADCVHEVRAGETMFRYSMNYGLPVNTIAAANGIVNPNLIIVGQRIAIPGCGTTGFRPPATSVPTATFGTGGFGTPGAGGGFATPIFTSTCGGQYVVQQYDTLFQISLACGVPVQNIANANNIVDINRIDMNTILIIPSQ